MHDGDGAFMGFVGTMTDITDQLDAVLARDRADALARHEHQRLSDLVAGAPEPILSISADGRILGMNPAGLTTFAMTRQEAVGRPLTDLVSGADRAYLRAQVEQVLHEGHRTQPVEVLAVGARPRMFLAQIVLIPMRRLAAEGDDAVVLTAIFRDVSDHHRARSSTSSGWRPSAPRASRPRPRAPSWRRGWRSCTRSRAPRTRSCR